MSQIDSRNSSATKRARTDGSRREDDWICTSCGNVNFSFRSTCNMRNCTQPKPDETKHSAKSFQTPHGGYSSFGPYAGSGTPSMYMGVPSYGSSVFNGSSGTHYDTSFPGRSAYYNYSSRLSSGNPYRSLPLSGAHGSMMGNAGMYGLSPIMDRYGFAFPQMMGPRSGYFSDDSSQRKEDWKCPSCGNINFSFRTVCNMRKCNSPKPGSQGSGKSEKGSKAGMPEGSWKCEKCDNINYPFREKCNRQNCGAEKPSSNAETASPAKEPPVAENEKVGLRKFSYKLVGNRFFLKFIYYDMNCECRIECCIVSYRWSNKCVMLFQ